MKQYIVLLGMVMLGLFIYACIAGPGDSILSALKEIWRAEALTGPYSPGSVSLS